jgi:hypothetical protein
LVESDALPASRRAPCSCAMSEAPPANGKHATMVFAETSEQNLMSIELVAATAPLGPEIFIFYFSQSVPWQGGQTIFNGSDVRPPPPPGHWLIGETGRTDRPIE